MIEKNQRDTEYSVEFERCIDVLSRIIIKYGNHMLENKTLGELLALNASEYCSVQK